MSEEVIRIQCTAVTKAGAQCRRMAQPGMVFCYVHREVEAPAQVATAVVTAAPEEKETPEELQALVAELDSLVANLKASVPEGDRSPYSPVHLLRLLRENLHTFSPEVRQSLLQSFEGMTAEDLLDIDTWKGMAYMLSYSARFQAGQVRERLNEQLPEPLQPDRLINVIKENLDRVMPEMAKDIRNSLQGASREDLLDPDTWKGIWYMLNYSLQFQAQQLKQRLMGEEE